MVSRNSLEAYEATADQLGAAGSKKHNSWLFSALVARVTRLFSHELTSIATSSILRLPDRPGRARIEYDWFRRKTNRAGLVRLIFAE